MGKIELWINGVSADLGNEAIILFNYTMEDLTNPAIVKNSYTQTVALQGTPTNNRIFSHIYRADRLTRSGFNPQERTPFQIVRDGELLESGYLKLDKVDKNGAKLTYNVTLYGGLGSFFYALAYRADGEKKTLADLDYIGDGSKLSYTLYGRNVIAAWESLGSMFNRSNIWHTFNFAPCYNGIPTDDFSPDKAIISNSNFRPYPDNVSNNGSGQYATSEFVQLSQSYDEWQTRDLRAYLQRPVVRVQSIFEALKGEATKNGFTLNLDSEFFYDRNPYYGNAWITRPLLNTLELKASSGNLNVEIPQTPQITPSTGSATVKLKTDIRTEGNMSIDGELSAKIHIALTGAGDLVSGDTLDLRDYVGDYPTFKYTLRARAFDGTIISTATYYVEVGNYTFTWNGREAVSNSVIFSLPPTTNVGWLEIEGSLSGDFTLRKTSDNSKTYQIEYIYLGDAVSSMYYSGGTSARTGTTVTQDDILNTSGTPADYLLSYCKMFGLHFTYDKLTKTVSIVTRNTLYQSGQTLNIESRIDRSKAISTTPYAFDAKLYDFGVENTEGVFVEYYKAAYGRDYGLHRVNTGYAFDSSNKDVMESVIFKGAATVLARGRYFTRITQGGKAIPPIFVDAGHKVSAVNTSNPADSIDYDIPCVNNSATIGYINATYKSYDATPKLQFCDDENSPIDGEDVLVFYNGSEINNDIIVSDDNVAVYAQYNEGIPCWHLQAYTNTDYPFPKFSRYSMSGTAANASLDFGIPAEIDIPGITHPSGTTVYDRGWAKYLADRYNVDTKVVKCNVDWRGIQVGEHLLRNFYYFDGAIWVLNKITNHDITGYGTTQCEFVKVQSKTNYLYGQNYDI